MTRVAQTSKRKLNTDEPDNHEMQTTAVHLTKEMWQLLRKVAFRRAEKTGGRSSVSSVVRKLIEAHRHELEDEAKSTR